MTTDQIIPMPGWALCETLKPISVTKGGLYLARDMETGKTTEGAARVLRITPARTGTGESIESGIKVGDILLLRDYLKNANPVGDLVNADRNDRVFLLNIKDALAVVTGPGTLGFYGEYEIPG